MANPSTWHVESGEKDSVLLHIQVAIGATGAVGAITDGNEFLQQASTPVTRNSAGVYTFKFAEGWGRLRMAVAHATGTLDSTAGTLGVCTTNTIANGPGGTSLLIVTMLRPDTGVAADPASGNVLSLTVIAAKGV